jgi:membrane peptidoglycan carboxypeptidase
LKRGKLLTGKPPRRGGRLTRREREASAAPEAASQILLILVLGCLVLGVVIGFGWGMDRQLRGGLLRQQAEAAQRPDWVPLETLPAYIPRAFITVVDPAFEEAGTFRGRGVRTTIPRELVRQIHLLSGGLPDDAKELVMAPVLTRRASKREMLEMYLNRVQLGTADESPVYGLYHAANDYMGKEPQQLTVGEAAALAGLLLDPRIERPQEKAGAVGIRRNEVLRALLSAGEISQAQYAEATGERLPFQPGLTDRPMTRWIPTDLDTAVIRLPQQYRPSPPEAGEEEVG